jgi:hypothetical protein
MPYGDKCLVCGNVLTGDNYSGDDDSYQFCDRCLQILEWIGADLDEAEMKINEHYTSERIKKARK